MRHRGDLMVRRDEPGGVAIELPGLEGEAAAVGRR